jgi:hypothetical protein
MRIPYEPVALTDSIVDDWIASYVTIDSAGGFPTMAAACSAVKKVLRQPVTLPPVRDVIVSTDDFVWIERDRGRPAASPHEWESLDPRGQVVATIVTPLDLRVVAVDRDRIWGLENNLDGTSRLVHYKLKRG